MEDKEAEEILESVSIDGLLLLIRIHFDEHLTSKKISEKGQELVIKIMEQEELLDDSQIQKMLSALENEGLIE